MSSPRRDPFELCGSTIDGKYRVISVVGEGGFGVVYRGVHQGFEAPIAVKCLKLPPHFDGEAQEELVRRLREEGRVLLTLSQRTSGILQALDVGSFTAPTGARVPYLILEWLEGRTLADELSARRSQGKGGMSLGEAIAILDSAARALSVAHEEKVAHRDIKPENLFLVESGGKATLKVLDFGIAKILADGPSAGEAKTSAGPSTFTPSYGAPEQFEKKRGASGPWTDVFAMALVLVELVTGRRALEGDELFELFRASVDPDVRPTLRARGVSAPEAVDRVIAKALHPEPRSRYADMGSFWGALTEAASGAGDVRGAAPKLASAAPADLADLSTAEFLKVDAATEPAPPSSSSRSPRVEAAAAPKNVPEPLDPRPVASTTKRGVAMTQEPPAAPKRRSPLALVAVGAACVVVAAGVFISWRSSPSPAPSTATSVRPPEAAIAAEPPPISKNPEAASLYKEALQAWHDGSIDAAVRVMEQAAAADRELGAAQLRLAIWKFNRKRVDAREHYQAATLHRGSMAEADAELLQATEPYMRQPWDLDEWGRRLEAITKKRPSDVELLVYLGLSHHARLHFDAAVEAYERALAIDPGFVAAYVLEADSLSVKGDAEGQLRALSACLERSPAAAQCLSKRAVLSGQIGKCAAMKDDSQRLLQIEPKSAQSQKQLAVALQASGGSKEAVLEALGRSWALTSDANRAVAELEDRAALAVLEGDFDASRAHLEAWQKAVADKPDQNAHAEPALELAKLYTEMGLPAKAGEVAGDFVRRMGAWTEPSSGGWSMSFLPYQRKAGSISEADVERGRAEWTETLRAKWKAAGRKLDEDFDWIVWTTAYGAVVDSEADARAAVGAMPKVASKAMQSGRWPAMDLNVGRALVLAGQPEPALKPLRRAAASCLGLTDPIVQIEAQHSLGMALEGTGDTDGARVAYQKVIERWGKAKPRSVTAEKAKKRLAGLKPK